MVRVAATAFLAAASTSAKAVAALGGGAGDL